MESPRDAEGELDMIKVRVEKKIKKRNILKLLMSVLVFVIIILVLVFVIVVLVLVVLVLMVVILVFMVVVLVFVLVVGMLVDMVTRLLELPRPRPIPPILLIVAQIECDFVAPGWDTELGVTEAHVDAHVAICATILAMVVVEIGSNADRLTVERNRETLASILVVGDPQRSDEIVRDHHRRWFGCAVGSIIDVEFGPWLNDRRNALRAGSGGHGKCSDGYRWANWAMVVLRKSLNLPFSFP